MSKSFNVTKCAWMYALVAALVLLMSAGLVQGQAQTATISGTATDASGGALAGASVQATNTATNVSQSTSTDPQGRYTIPQLAVGTYTVQASLAGFKTVVHTGIVLSVGGTLVVDFSLPVGQVTQTVNVEAEVSRVETETSEVSTLISPQQMRDLPLNGRNFEQLITLAPGVATIAPAFNAVTGRLYGMMNNYSVSGSRPTGQMFLLDGTDIRDFWEHGTGSGYGGTSLGVEAIAEFQVLTNTYTSQFAGNGAVVNATSRSGTNDLHGGAYEFIRNSALDAMDLPDKNAGLTQAPPFKRNQFGGDLGGPIKKDKLFFFGNYEGLRQGLETTSPIFLPEPYVVQGKVPCYNPSTGVSTNSNAACPAAPPANCATTSSCPAVGAPGNPVDAVPGVSTQAEQIASLYSLCKGCRVSGAGTDLGGFFAGATTPNLIVNEDYVLGRVDYTLGSNDSLFGRYVIDDARVGDNPRDPLGVFPEQDFTRNQFVTITERHVVSATMVNSVHFGYTRNNENSRVAPHLSQAQITKASGFFVAENPAAAPFTTDPLYFTKNYPDAATREDGQENPFGGIVTIGPDQNRPDELIQSKFSGADDIEWTHGAHSIRIGGVVTRVQTNNIQAAYADGTLFLVNLTLQAYLQGSPLLAFSVNPGLNNSTRYFREINVAPYFQDDWKVTSQLTLNLGLRYDFDTNPVGWAAPNVAGGKSQPLTVLVGSYLPPVGPVTPGNGLPAFTPVKHVFAANPNGANFGPRFGFAYDPFKDHKTSIRGGFGLFYDPTAPRLYESGFIATPPAGFTFSILPCFPDVTKVVLPPAGFCGVIQEPPSEFAGVTYQTPRGSPYQMQYNLNIQREIARGTVLSVGYVGSVSRHLWTQMDINPPKCGIDENNPIQAGYPNCTALPQIPNARPTASNGTYTFIPGSADACQLPAQNNGGLGVGSIGTGCYGSGIFNPGFSLAGTPLASNFRINPAFGEMIQAQNTGSAEYSSLQVSLNRQFAHNIAGQVNYTWSRCVDNGSFASSLEEWGQLVTDPYNQRYDYGNCNFDIRHNFSANGLYALPFKGNQLVEGWQFSAILGIHTGLPLNVYNGSTSDPANLGSEWASRANYSFAAGCSPNHLLKQNTTIDLIRGVQWFDPSCYEAQAPGYWGNIKRNSLPGPGTVGADISITKNTKLTEKLNMQFRAEAFNFINHFNPGGASPTSPTVLGAINQPAGFNGFTAFSQAPVVNPRQIQFAVKFDF